METKLLITPEQVVELAFGCDCDKHLVTDIGEPTIMAAESKFVVPVFGAEMVEQMRSGSYAELVECYLRPALALYVKYLALPTLAIKVGTAGVVTYTGEGFEPSDEQAVKKLLRRTKADADALIDRAVAVVEAAPSNSYPLYNPAHNIRHRVNISSGIVL